MFTLVVEDEDVKNVVRLIIDTNSTKTPGDGKIFVQPIIESYRIRNGETSADAY
jgi:nitrogen regulatory protein PII 2